MFGVKCRAVEEAISVSGGRRNELHDGTSRLTDKYESGPWKKACVCLLARPLLAYQRELLPSRVRKLIMPRGALHKRLNISYQLVVHL